MNNLTYGTKYLRMNQVKFVEAFKNLNGYGLLQAYHTPSNFSEGVLHKPLKN